MVATAEVVVLVEVGDGGVAHGCFLRENGRSGLEGQCLGLTAGAGQSEGSDSGQILLDKFLYTFHLL